jgi:hypothetical protein
MMAAVIVAAVQCSNHETESRAMHSHEEGPMRIKAQSRISMLKGGTNGYGARVQIREDLHGRKHAHAMAICDCNGQGEYITPKYANENMHSRLWIGRRSKKI